MKAIRIKFDEAQLATMQQFLRSGVAQKAAKAGLLSAALRGRAHVVRETGKKGKVDTGRFRNSWKAESINRGAKLFNSAPYAAVIEGGRRPGARMPPLGPIAAWAKRKGITIPAIMIARAIAARGIPGTFILRDALPNIQKFVDREVRREVRRAFKSFLGGPRAPGAPKARAKASVKSKGTTIVIGGTTIRIGGDP